MVREQPARAAGRCLVVTQGGYHLDSVTAYALFVTSFRIFRVVLSDDVFSQIRTISTERIGKRIASATPEESAQVLESLHEILGA